MDFFKTLGRGIYFRARRLKKALKNWRKFGVVIFGSLLLASNSGLLIQPVVAEAAGNVAYLRIDPHEMAIKAGESYTFNYQAYDDDWSPVEIDAEWSVVKAAAGSIAADGTFTAGATKGTYSNAIKLSAGTVAAYAKVVVLEADSSDPEDPEAVLTYLRVDPHEMAIKAGESYTFNYQAYDQDWNPMTIAPTWSMANPAAGSIAADGTFTAGATKGTYSNAIKLSANNLSTYAKVVVLGNEVVVNQPPVASLAAVPASGVAPLSTTLDASGSYDLDGSIVRYSWDYTNDGAFDHVGSTSTTSHTYTNPGTYAARVEVMDDDGDTASAYATITVSNVVVDQLMIDAAADDNPISTYDSTRISAWTTRGSQMVTGYSNFYWTVVGGSAYGYVDNPYTYNTYFHSTGVTGTVTLQVQATQGGDTVSTTVHVSVQDSTPTNYITIDATPYEDSVYKYGWQTYMARVYDRYGNNVTGDSSVYWNLPDSSSNAGVIIDDQTNYGSYAKVTVRAGGNLGYFPIEVRAWYGNGLYATDTSYLNVVTQNVTQDYWLNGSLYGVIEDGSTPSEGDVIVYTLRLANYRPNTVHNTLVSMPVPAHTTFLEAYSDTDNPTLKSGKIYWDAGTFYSGTVKTMTVRVEINDGLPSNGTTIQARAHVTADEISGFYLYSNTMYLNGSGGYIDYDYDDLVDTGIETDMLAMLAVAALALSFMAYAFINRREIVRQLRG